ncbi:MAG: dihydroorotate dehydrogenase electron transfer subunit [Spirochaetota bacterium]
MPLFDSRVTANREIARDYLQMDLEWPADAPAPEPGQFLTLRAGSGPAPLLRRPFGICAFSEAVGPTASLIYWRRGPATRLLAGLEPGDQIDVLAPLGVGFPDPPEGAVPVLVAGGVGVGPLLYLANHLAQLGSSPIMLLGARTNAYLPSLELDTAVQLRLATDDGSHGFHGTVIELLRRTIPVTGGAIELYLCGPDRMLASGHAVAQEYGIPAWVSMEQTMGCAVGACMGCAVRVHTRERYARVCTEGPVFRSTEIVWP